MIYNTDNMERKKNEIKRRVEMARAGFYSAVTPKTVMEEVTRRIQSMIREKITGLPKRRQKDVI